MKRAVVFGASGFVGRFLVDLLLKSPNYDRVTVVVRKDSGLKHPKLVTLVADFHSLDKVADQIEADEVFITLGTTKKKTPDLKEYYQVDHDYPVRAATIGKDRGARSVFLLTAVGANDQSGVFYIRTKGEVERDVIAVGLEETHIFQPSMILGERKEFRLLERIVMGTWPVADGLLRLLGASKYRGIKGEDIARAMVAAADQTGRSVHRYEWNEMMELSEKLGPKA